MKITIKKCKKERGVSLNKAVIGLNSYIKKKPNEKKEKKNKRKIKRK